MSTSLLPRAFLGPVVIAIAIGTLGCDGCSLTSLADSSSTLSIEDITGQWHVSTYASDNDGCQPQRTAAPLERLEIALDESSEDSDGRRLEVLVCPSDDHCFDKAIPENQLNWDDELEQASITHHTANLLQNDPVDTTCRLAAQHTILSPHGATLTLTRSHYEVDLPTEGDEACTPELAEEYHSHMPCVRGESIELTRAGEESDS